MTDIAVVSGGTRGIGAAMSGRLDKLGYRVVAAYRSNRTAADAVATAGVTPVQVDVSDPEACEKLVEKVVDEFERIDALVNCAGPYVREPLLEQSAETWQAP